MAISPYPQAQEGSPERDISDAKHRLLKKRLSGLSLQPERDPILPRPSGVPTPLSPEQRRIWLHAAQQPDAPVYNEPFTLYRHGSLDIAILEAAFNEIIRRHEALRTRFTAVGEQIVVPEWPQKLSLADLSALDPSKREAEALRLAGEDAQKQIPFDAFPLFRILVVRLSAQEHRIYLVFHHLIFDNHSNERVLLPELAAIYSAFAAGEPAPLPPPSIQYGDYAWWRNRQAGSRSFQSHLAWWLDQLSGDLPDLRLPEDHPRVLNTDYRGRMESFSIDAPTAERLRRLSLTQGVSLYATLMAAFHLLLFRYTGQNDLIVGSSASARRQTELVPVIGCFLDTFVVRSRPTAQLTFTHFMHQLWESILGGLAAAEVPFDRLVQELKPQRRIGRNPIFDLFFSVLPPAPQIDGWSTAQRDIHVGACKFDLHLEVQDAPSGELPFRLLYRTDILEPATIERIARHWRTLLQSIVANPEAELGALEIVDPDELAQLFGPSGWNDTAQPYPHFTLPAIFEEQVRRTPDKIAGVFAEQSYTYAQLNARANQIASKLIAAGVTPGSIVAVLLDRSLDLLAGLLAVHKTGAAYLPVDIRAPRARIEACLRDAAPAAILTQQSLADRTADSPLPRIWLNDPLRTAIQPPTATMPLRAATPEGIAYLIQTSGTTGEPKSVEISHRSLVNLLFSMQRQPGMTPEDTLLAVTPVSFDIAALELFLPLITGATVVIADSNQARDPQLLAEAIESSGCTILQATPTTWRMLTGFGWNGLRRNGAPGALRLILCGGEPLTRDLAERLLATGAELWNMYGPTETTIWSTIAQVHPGAAGAVPIGLPIANTTAYILDRQLRQLPVGVPGELFLGGDGLARGYRSRPEQTAERFLAIESAGGARLYRTGDLAVRRPSGSLEVLGRVDNQVKIRGHRIELEAVEAAVLRHPGVAAAAARTWIEPSGDARLSAYIVPRDSSSPPNIITMHAFLLAHVPESMIPSDLIVLPSIPLTAHGKTDRACLPRPEPDAASTSAAEAPHGSPEEKRLAGIWANLLGRSSVGVEDNFFDLGGHSILVPALQQRILEEFGRHISIVELFNWPTVRHQARLLGLDNPASVQISSGVDALRPHGDQGAIFWIHCMQPELAKAIESNHRFYSVALTPEELEALDSSVSISDLAGRIIEKIIATEPQGPYLIGGLCAFGILAYEVASQMRARGLAVAMVVILDAPNPTCHESPHSLRQRFSYLPYGFKRVLQLDFKVTLIYLGERISKSFADRNRAKSFPSEVRLAEDIVVAAARRYSPGAYGGEVLLLLASERPPYLNFLAGWKKVVTGTLHTRYIHGHHRNLLETGNVRHVGQVLTSVLVSSRQDSSEIVPELGKQE